MAVRVRVGGRGRAGGLVSVALVSVALLLAGCTGDGSSREDGRGSQPGGTLTIVGSADVDHLDTATAYHRPTYLLHRAITRQLLQYPTAEDPQVAVQVAADLAERVPQPTDGGRTYTLTLREGVRWDTQPPRQIVADDVVRGFERLCHPGRPTGGPRYIEGLIEGMTQFCQGFASVPVTTGAINSYLKEHSVSGLEAVDTRTVRITLERPAADFPHLLALPAASPVPAEALQHLPDSLDFRRHYVASGPYRIAEYTPNEGFTLERNPAWRADTDPLRRAYVDRIEIVQGSDDGVAQERLEAGTADLAWDVTVPVGEVARLLAARDPKLRLVPDGSNDPYLAVNIRSPSSRGALGSVLVRQALNYAVDKRALAELYGGVALRRPSDQVLTPALAGYRRQSPYATPGHRGDPAKARRLLARAGYPDGVRLTLVYRDAGRHPDVAASVRAALGRAGITLSLRAVGVGAFYDDFVRSPDVTRRGEWDLAVAGWGPDWYGAAARSVFVPLFDGRACRPERGSANFACYNDEAVNRLIDKALSAPSVDQAAALWAEADRQVMSDAPFVPLLTGHTPVYHSKRVRGAVVQPFFANYDPTNLWLAD
jgi:peptide/nickel transport system substrate-binding protein